MKKITFRLETTHGQLPELKSVLKQVMGSSPIKPLNVEEMRKRVRVIDVLEKMPDDTRYFVLEDSDYDVLLSALNTFPWAQASKLLVNLIDDVTAAQSFSHLNLVDDKKEG